MRRSALLSLMLLAGCGRQEDASPGGGAAGPATPPIAVEVNALYQEYEHDLAGAERKYNGKTVEVRDAGGHVEKAEDGRLVFVADMRRQARFPDRIEYLPGVLMYVSKDAAKGFEGVSGRKVTVRGGCKGAVNDKKAFPAFVVVIEDCRVVP